MTKREITSFVWNNLQKFDKTNKYHPVVIEMAITLAFNQGYTEVFEKDPRRLDNFTVSYGETGDTLLTELNADGNLMYEVLLPVSYVPLNDKASGVRHVFTLAKSSTKFYPMYKYELDIADNTLMGEIDNRIGYCVRQTKLEFYRMTGVTSIRIDVVQPFTSYNATDDINIPFGNDQKLMDMVIEKLRGLPLVDLKDDNSDKKLWPTR